jgi:hypothetical protein
MNSGAGNSTSSKRGILLTYRGLQQHCEGCSNIRPYLLAITLYPNFASSFNFFLESTLGRPDEARQTIITVLDFSSIPHRGLSISPYMNPCRYASPTNRKVPVSSTGRRIRGTSESRMLRVEESLYFWSF